MNIIKIPPRYKKIIGPCGFEHWVTIWNIDDLPKYDEPIDIIPSMLEYRTYGLKEDVERF